MRTPRIVLLLVATALLGAAACSSSGEDTASASASASDATEGRTIIDVRTPEEFAEGHLVDAVNLDLQSGQFAEEIVDLPRDGSYFLYCRTGNRSGQAEAIMRDLGFDDVVNGGGYADLEAAGHPTA
jgi:phage shock protein E